MVWNPRRIGAALVAVALPPALGACESMSQDDIDTLTGALQAFTAGFTGNSYSPASSYSSAPPTQGGYVTAPAGGSGAMARDGSHCVAYAPKGTHGPFATFTNNCPFRLMVTFCYEGEGPFSCHRQEFGGVGPLDPGERGSVSNPGPAQTYVRRLACEFPGGQPNYPLRYEGHIANWCEET